MGVGKYSPTVTTSYARDQKWHEKNGGGYGNGVYPDSDNDDEGYDSYGYGGNGCGPDRAGNTEDQYLTTRSRDSEDNLRYPLYEQVSDDWSGIVLGKDKVDTYPVQPDSIAPDVPMFENGVTIEKIKEMREETGMGLQQCKRILTLEAINTSVRNAKTWDEAKPALLALIGQIL